MTTDYRRGIRRTSVMVNIVAAGAATAVLIHPIPAGRSAIIRKISWSENMGNAGHIFIGHSAAGAFVQDMPPIDAPANITGTIEENEIPNREFVPSPAGLTTQDIYARTDASTNLSIQIEVEEYGA